MSGSDPVTVIGPILVGRIGGVQSILCLKWPETVRKWALRYALFTPDNWINKLGYLVYIKVQGLRGLIMAGVSLCIGIRNLVK